jgi:diguanylate cyclase (GGDEF)-like protein/PAS domain S-box-containing protein
MTPPAAEVRVLLVDDDEDDAFLTRGLLASVAAPAFAVDWALTHADVERHLAAGPHDVYLVDYRLGEHTGLEVARTILLRAHGAPVIMLTGYRDRDVDLRAAELGIADYLVKGELDASTLERSIRYAIRHQRVLSALAESEERYALALAGANDGLWDWDLRSSRLYLSARCKAMLGFTAVEGGEDPEEWLSRVHPEDRPAVDAALSDHLAGRTDHYETEYRILTRDGRHRWMLARGLAVRGIDGQATRIAGSQTDVTDRKRAERQLQHDALHDALTGLPNRVLFCDRLDHAMRRDARRSQPPVVLFLDLDRFKIVNDSLGHQVGDRLLSEVARRLQLALRPGDTVARLGGDEFTVLLEDLESPADAGAIADRILGSLTAPFVVEDRELFLSASVGIAVAAHEARPEDVIRDADAAMYRAKAEGKNRHALFDTALHDAAMARLEVETELRRGLRSPHDGTALEVVYQPIVRASDGRLHGYEALARWRSPDGRLRGPDQFIPVAEETGLISELGRLVLRAACAQLARWRVEHDAHELTMAVNISGRQLLEPGFPDVVAAAVHDHGLDPQALRLEITETAAAADYAAVRSALEHLDAATGVRTHLDDFGTGTSSLTFLRGFPGDVLKIDRSFVLAMGGDEGAFQIVKAILRLAHDLGLAVVAEGVETEWQLGVLRDLRCEYAQGFLIARPLPPAAAGALIARGVAVSPG